jgi:hypothetical protein
MLRSICALLLAVAIAGAANGASLSINPDKLTYDIGETITVTIFGDDQGASAYGIFGRLLYNGYLVDNGTRSQDTLVASDGYHWVKGALEAHDTGANSATSGDSEAFDQVNLPGEDAANLPGTFSTVTLIAQNVGILDLNWDTSGHTGFELYFFGATSAPGASVTIVPEPATAVLFAAGLLAFAVSRRALREGSR